MRYNHLVNLNYIINIYKYICKLMVVMEDKNILPDYVKGHIYVAINKVTGKKYVGKTRTHIWHHGKYRNFGYIRRWNGHLSEAINNVKKNQCTYLNNSIRKHGKNNWTLKLLFVCDFDMLNYYENLFVKLEKTIF